MNPQSIAYLKALREVYNSPDYTTETSGSHPNEQGTREKVNVHITISNPTREPVRTGYADRDETIRDYFTKETVEFDKGNITTMGSISSFWDKIRNPDGTINANYGYMVYHLKDAGNPLYDPTSQSQWEWAKSRLVGRKDSRQAVMHFNRPKDQWSGNLDQPCCMYSQFLIRNDKLYLSVCMRSNDLWFGTPYNWSYHIELLYRMCDELQVTYPSLTVGDMYFSTASLHIYSRHYRKVEEVLAKSDFLPSF